jgi:hypothetical protein
LNITSSLLCSNKNINFSKAESQTVFKK